MRRRAAWGVVMLWIAYVIIGHRYANAWTSDRTLWNYAVQQTPVFDLAILNAAIVNHP